MEDGSTKQDHFHLLKILLDGIIKILNYEESDVFNIGNENEITINDFAEKIID